MMYVLVWALVWGTVGSFGTAFLHDKTGRDVTMGGLIGLAVGGIFLLVMLWVWLYYFANGSIGRVYGRTRKPWYRVPRLSRFAPTRLVPFRVCICGLKNGGAL